MAKSKDDAIQPLIPTITLHPTPTPTHHLQQKHCLSFCLSWLSKSKKIPRSKAAFMILIWNVIVSMTYAAVIVGAMAIPLILLKMAPYVVVNYIVIGVYAGIALLQILFYPLGGLLADVFYGRHKIMLGSFFHIGSGYLFLVVLGMIWLTSHNAKEIVIVTACIGTLVALLLITGFTGFQANAVQFGLDQLLEASSEELSVFLHWYVWTDDVGTLLSHLIGAIIVCNFPLRNAVKYFPLPTFLISGVLIFISCYKYTWFRSEPHTRNPYGTIFKVLKFAVKHDKPLRRSAMTFCDDERPTRLDFAKQRFGGPFTTEEVEDVKTFLRILVMLLAIGPIFYLHVAIIYLFPMYGMHIGPDKAISIKHSCQYTWVILRSGNLTYIISTIALPTYILFFHRYVSKWLPRILFRLRIGMILMVFAALSMLAIEVGGHLYASHHHTTKDISCFFISEYRRNSNFSFSQTLELHPIVLAAPCFFSGIAAPLIYISILEFISAQSPHTMKGLLMGVFYAVRGFFILLGLITLFPFSQVKLWGGYHSVINCGFYYYLLNFIVGCFCVLIFWVAVRWYHYRDREDRPYGPQYVENYYSIYARRNTSLASSPDEAGSLTGSLAAAAQTDYGATSNRQT